MFKPRGSLTDYNPELYPNTPAPSETLTVSRRIPTRSQRCGAELGASTEISLLPVLPPAILVLADGSRFIGISIGAPGQTCGEVVFNTALTGYQEILTDPSYCRGSSR